MSEPVVFQGQQLPPLRDGNVWAMRIWPGGRLETLQVEPRRITKHAVLAILKLRRGEYVYVWLDNAAYVASRWKQDRHERK